MNVSDFYDQNRFLDKITNFKNTVLNKTDSMINDTQLFNESNTTEHDGNIYKWQDDKGVWHYSDKPNKKSEQWNIPENLTVIPAIKTLPTKDTDTQDGTRLNSEKPVQKSSNKVNELINDAQNVQEIMNNRTKTLDEQLNNIH